MLFTAKRWFTSLGHQGFAGIPLQKMIYDSVIQTGHPTKQRVPVLLLHPKHVEMDQ
jgi:hypothetical protein